MTQDGSGAGLLGRREECRLLDELLAGVRNGQSAALVLRGEAGIGKTELLAYLGKRSVECRIARAAGIQSEMELSYASLHQLCAPLMEGLPHLPEPQRDAIATAFGLRTGAAPDRFLVGLAALSLLARAAESQPLVCIVDDAQWLDQASAMALGFLGRRLLAESVLLVFAVREPSSGKVLEGLAELPVNGLPERASHVLLDSVGSGPLDRRVRDRILAEARGNPLALLELPRGLTAPEMVDAFVGGSSRPLPSQIERRFLDRVQSLPADIQRVIVLAAAEPVGDVTLLRRAAGRLGVDVDLAAAHPTAAELITLDTRVRFRHPLVRSAAYMGASPSDRHEAHQALADSMDANVDPDRRAWHRAQATSEPDEDVAVELERSADRAQARGGMVAVAAFLARATELTQDPARRSQRALNAAQAKVQAGAFDSGSALLAIAEGGFLDELSRARADRLHAEIAYAEGRGLEALSLLLAAANRLEELDGALARETYLEAVQAVVLAAQLARNPGWQEVGEAARRAPPSSQPLRAPDMLLDALAVRLTDGFAASAPMIGRALTAFCEDDVSVQDSLRWLLLAGVVAADLWDLERWQLVEARLVKVTRETGALSALPLALDATAVVHVFAGELVAAAAVVEEVRTVSAAIGTNQPVFGALALAAISGHEREARTLIEATVREAGVYGLGLMVTSAHYHHAVLCNGLSQYQEAETAARAAATHQEDFGAPQWALAELVEAAARQRASERASEALEQLSGIAQVSGTEWALGVEARSRALVSDGPDAERLYREAIERLSRTRVRIHLARAHLVYGEWLRRENRRVDARVQLGVAHEMLTQFGAQAFADRARHELAAVGAKVRQGPVATSVVLTPQEEQIARLAGDGLTNPEIGSRLFLSHHTVEWHLRKVFSKLGIASRREISNALPQLTTLV